MQDFIPRRPGAFRRQTFAAVLVPGMICMATAVADPASSQSADKMPSILDLQPAVYYGMKRYPKFYSDPNMSDAAGGESILERQYIFGSLGGTRDNWAQNGVVVDAGVTQVYQGSVSGDGDTSKNLGSADLWLTLDSGRAGLWPGGVIYAHVESNWGDNVTGTGALLPVNGDAIMPAAPSSTTLSELYLMQGLPNNYAAIVGKVNFSGLADKSIFANDERNQFLYEGLINNPLLGSFIPYTTLGFGAVKVFNEEVTGVIIAASNDSDAIRSGFDTYSADAMTYGGALTWTPKFGGKPGLYDVVLGYSTKAVPAFDIDKRYLFEEIVGVVPVAEKDNNYAAVFGASQYVWVDEGANRSDGQPAGFGPFFRAGMVPSDRNLFDSFVSIGLGGFGGPGRRVNDNWGVGWAATHSSSDLRSDLEVLTVKLDAYEHAVEAFYNVALTPAVRWSFHLQRIDSLNPEEDNSVLFATRLQLDL